MTRKICFRQTRPLLVFDAGDPKSYGYLTIFAALCNFSFVTVACNFPLAKFCVEENFGRIGSLRCFVGRRAEKILRALLHRAKFDGGKRIFVFIVKEALVFQINVGFAMFFDVSAERFDAFRHFLTLF